MVTGPVTLCIPSAAAFFFTFLFAPSLYSKLSIFKVVNIKVGDDSNCAVLAGMNDDFPTKSEKKVDFELLLEHTRKVGEHRWCNFYCVRLFNYICNEFLELVVSIVGSEL